MKIAFTLTMPGNNAWNGKWTGEGRLYVKVVDVGASKKTIEKYAPLLGKAFSFDFGDGWRACVSIRQVEGREARQLKAESAGFCGYDWMIEDIRTYGKIRSFKEREVAT
jgi:hypothetical protein